MKKLFSEIPYIRDGDLELRKLTLNDADALRELTYSEEVYRFLPTFLFEKKYDNAEEVISKLYDECLEESLILGIFLCGEFCGLKEIYGYRPEFKKVSVGCRLLPRFWGKGIAGRVMDLVVEYLFNETEIRIITASVDPKNKASAEALKKKGFRCVLHSVPENWGNPLPNFTDKWVKTSDGRLYEYSFRPDDR